MFVCRSSMLTVLQLPSGSASVFTVSCSLPPISWRAVPRLPGRQDPSVLPSRQRPTSSRQMPCFTQPSLQTEGERGDDCRHSGDGETHRDHRGAAAADGRPQPRRRGGPPHHESRPAVLLKHLAIRASLQLGPTAPRPPLRVSRICISPNFAQNVDGHCASVQRS